MDEERLKLIALREEIERELGIKFQFDEKEFVLGEDIKITQGRSSIAGHGSGAFHTYLKQTNLEQGRRDRMAQEWDRAVHRLEKLKEQRAIEAKFHTGSKNKKKKTNKKKKRENSDDSTDDDNSMDFVSLFNNSTENHTQFDKKTDNNEQIPEMTTDIAVTASIQSHQDEIPANNLNTAIKRKYISEIDVISEEVPKADDNSSKYDQKSNNDQNHVDISVFESKKPIDGDNV